MTYTKRSAVTAVAVGAAAFSLFGAAVMAPANAATANPAAEAAKLAGAAMKAPTSILQNVPLKTAAPKGQSVIFLNNGNASTVEIAGGVKQAAQAGGWDYSEIAYNTANPATLQQAFMNALQKKPTGVILAGESPANWSKSVVDAYAAAKIPIIAGSTCPVDQIGSVFPGSGTCAQNPRTGKALADWVVADSKGKPVNVLMQSMPVYNVYIGFRDGFRAELKRLSPASTATIQETTLTQFAAGQIPSALVNTLRSNPNMTYLVFDNGAWARGIIPALKAAGLQGKVTVIGQGGNDDILAQLKARAVAAWTFNSFTGYGMASFDSLLRVITKSSGISKNSAQPFQLVIPPAADTISLPYLEPTAALSQYKKLWKW